MNIVRPVDLKLNALTHKLRRVPVVALMPHSRCNCRCIMCDIWKANRHGRSISQEQLDGLMGDFRQLRVEWVLLSGGEPLMHPNLWALCSTLKTLPARITLLSTGLLLERNARDIVRHCDEVIVSLDGSEGVHDRIRGIDGAFRELAEGVAALKRLDAGFPVSARSVLQRENFADLPNIVAAARKLQLDRISFLAADVHSAAFNRPEGWTPERSEQVCLSAEQAARFAEVVESCVREHAEAFASGFIVETPERLRKLVAYYRAANGLGAFPDNDCNAPWVSAVIEADGSVRPCFFHRTLGNINERGIEEILNSDEAIAFRRGLDVREDETCRRCVCTFNLRR